jgi:hypothetical protein
MNHPFVRQLKLLFIKKEKNFFPGYYPSYMGGGD